jgi:hypothetical protein
MIRIFLLSGQNVEEIGSQICYDRKRLFIIISYCTCTVGLVLAFSFDICEC